MSSPCLVIDIGNTVLHWGFSEDGQSIHSSGKLRHWEADKLPKNLDLTQNKKPKVLVASVNPKPLPLLRKSVEATWGDSYLELIAGKNWCPEIKVDHPEEVGIDRLVNARAVKENFPNGVIIVDHGTALTIDYIAPGGVYSGGTIVPGIRMSTKALAEKTSLIPRVSFAAPTSVVGTNTVDCVRSGLYFGLVGLVQHIVLLIRQENNAELPVVITGGDAEFLLKECSFTAIYDAQLTLQGMLKAGFDMKFWDL